MAAGNVLVLGGSGFIGRHLVPRLDEAGYRVTVPSRRRERARHLILLPKCDVVEADVGDDAVLSRLVAGQQAVVNLIGILHGRAGTGDDPYGPDFGRAHVTLMERLIVAMTQHRVARIVHVSALGVDPTDPKSPPSHYLRSKSAAERLLRASTLDWTILRPSVIFGPEDRLLNTFARLQRVLPVMAVANPEARFQPVYVGDVADAIKTCIGSIETIGKTFELAGPQTLTLAELTRFAGAASGHPRPVVTLPPRLGNLQALVLEKLPGPTLMSRDNLASMTIDSVASGPIDPLLGITPTPLEAIAPGYLKPTDSPFNAERRRH
ncbi:MAG: complex I NDUFA9 subunit family protein [Lautropia sp.]